MRLYFLSIGGLVFLFLSLFFVLDSKAQTNWRDLNIVSTYKVEDSSVSAGEIISYNPENKTYIKSNQSGDKNMLGVVAKDALLVFGKKDEVNNVPVVTSGKVIVKVTTVGGEIKHGDLITSSDWPGRGRKAKSNEKYILGVAIASLNSENGLATTTPSGKNVFIGEVPVVIGELGSAMAKEQASSSINSEGEFFGVTIVNTVQYLVAVFVAFGVTFIAFRNFMPNIKQGLASIGRNPMAKSSIQWMIIFNIFLIIIVTIMGFIFGLAIIMLPV